MEIEYDLGVPEQFKVKRIKAIDGFSEDAARMVLGQKFSIGEKPKRFLKAVVVNGPLLDAISYYDSALA